MRILDRHICLYKILSILINQYDLAIFQINHALLISCQPAGENPIFNLLYHLLKCIRSNVILPDRSLLCFYINQQFASSAGSNALYVLDCTDLVLLIVQVNKHNFCFLIVIIGIRSQKQNQLFSRIRNTVSLLKSRLMCYNISGDENEEIRDNH